MATVARGGDVALPVRPRHLSRRRHLPTAGSLSLVERKGGRWLSGGRHPEECGQFRKLFLADEGETLSRPRFATRWAVTGAALRVCATSAEERQRPILMNEGWDCFELASAFPEFSALTARQLMPGLLNRVVFELRTEPTALPHVCQVGIARRAGDDWPSLSSMQDAPRRFDTDSGVIDAVAVTSAGEVTLSGTVAEAVFPLEVLESHGGNSGFILRGSGDWCSGGPLWLQADGALISRVTLDVDLAAGRLSVSVGPSSGEAAQTVAIPALVNSKGGGWRPFVSLTAVGQQARILDVHAKIIA